LFSELAYEPMRLASTSKTQANVPYRTKIKELFNMIDRRVLKTRQALQKALISLMIEKGYESLTVQDVLDRANVGRSTFYAHFYDLDDLLESEFEVLQAEFEQHIASHGSAMSIWELSRLVFQHAQAYKALYKAVVGKEAGQFIQAHLRRYLTEQIRIRLKTDYADRLDELLTLDILEHYLVNNFMGLLTYWLDKDLSHSAEQMAELYEELVRNGLAKF
jgi:AcrR family transcriptional regulator